MNTAEPSTPKESTLFFYQVKGEEKGPYTLNQLRSMWDSGQITADAVCRSSDSSEWFPIGQRIAREEGTVEPPSPTRKRSRRPTQRVQKAESGGEKKTASNSKQGCLGCLGCLGVLGVVLFIIGLWTFIGANNQAKLETGQSVGDVFENSYKETVARGAGYNSFTDALAAKNRESGSFFMFIGGALLGAFLIVWAVRKHGRKSANGKNIQPTKPTE